MLDRGPEAGVMRLTALRCRGVMAVEGVFTLAAGTCCMEGAGPACTGPDDVQVLHVCRPMQWLHCEVALSHVKNPICDLDTAKPIHRRQGYGDIYIYISIIISNTSMDLAHT